MRISVPYKAIPVLDEGGQKKSYDTPEVTTFGSVAKLTMGTGGSHNDFWGRHHNYGHGNG